MLLVNILTEIAKALKKEVSDDEKIGFSREELETLGVEFIPFDFTQDLPDQIWQKNNLILMKAKNSENLLIGLKCESQKSFIEDGSAGAWETSGNCAYAIIEPDSANEFLPYLETGEDVCFYLDAVSMIPGYYSTCSCYQPWDDGVATYDDAMETHEVIDALLREQRVDPIKSRLAGKTVKIENYQDPRNPEDPAEFDYNKASDAAADEALIESLMDLSNLSGFIMKIPEDYIPEETQEIPKDPENRMADFEEIEEPEPEPEESESEEEESESELDKISDELNILYRNMKEIQDRISELEKIKTQKMKQKIAELKESISRRKSQMKDSV